MRNRFVLAFILIGMLIACVGLQSTPNTGYNMTHAPHDTARAEATLGTENSFSLTEDSRLITETAYLASLPTLNAEEGQIARQTQAALVTQEFTRITHDAVVQETSFAIRTDSAEAAAQGTDTFALTATLIIETATAYSVLATANADANATVLAGWQLTTIADSERATADAQSSPTPCSNFAWTKIEFVYRGGVENLEIHDRLLAFCSLDIHPFIYTSHGIIVADTNFDEELRARILEDAISRLPDYPPHRPEVSEMIHIVYYNLHGWRCGLFSYSDAIARYEEGLRGTDLMQALGTYSC